MENPNCFINYFQPVIASNDALRLQVYRIRYDVYCAELALENGCPDNLEADEFDTYSFHYLLKHRASNQFAGTMRMVMPPPNQPELLIPLEKYCLDAVDRSIMDIKKLPRGSFAEVSRLAVNRSFRRRVGDFCKLKEDQGKVSSVNNNSYRVTVGDRRQSPNIAVGLYLIAASLFTLKKLDYIFIMINPGLMKTLNRAGLYFEQMGNAIDYHGLRAPFYITPENLNRFLKPEYRLLRDTIMRQVSSDLMLGR